MEVRVLRKQADKSHAHSHSVAHRHSRSRTTHHRSRSRTTHRHHSQSGSTHCRSPSRMTHHRSQSRTTHHRSRSRTTHHSWNRTTHHRSQSRTTLHRSRSRGAPETPFPSILPNSRGEPLEPRPPERSPLTAQSSMLKLHIIHQGIQTLQIPAEPLAKRLTHHLHNWQATTQDRWVINTVQGYKTDFWTKPQQKHPPLTPQFSADQLQLITEEITELLQKQAIEEVQPSEGFYSNLFLVPKKDGGSVQSST